MLVVEPRNGLANRLRVIDSGVALAKKLNMQLVIDWILNEDINCRFDKLFEPIDGLILNDGIKLSFPFKNYTKLHFLYKSLKFDISLDSDILRAKMDWADYKIGNEDLNVYLNKYKKIYISTGEAFFDSPKDYYYFKPKPEIMNRVDAMCENLGKDFIGIHIRRTDNKNAISYSPTSLFIETIRSILELKSSTKFFLSTDSVEDDVLLKQTFPDNIFSYPKLLDRNAEDGIKAALVDMLCLSKAVKIYGSYFSSFSEAASYMSGNELIILKNS